MRLLFIILILIQCPRLLAQTIPIIKDNRQNPSSVSWRSIESAHFEIIFPDFVETEAKRLAALMEVLYLPVSESLYEAPKKLSLVLHPNFLDANAFVTLAPRRSEWFMTPYMGIELGQSDWLSTLGVHEYRHVVQFEKSNDGFGRFMNIFMGETGQALITGWAIPSWYMEGDAVGIETALSSSGRGRVPIFERDLRAMVMSDQKINYDPLNLGSYKTYYPNHYVFGYFLTTYLRKHYGKDILFKIHKEAMHRAYNPLAFLNAVRSETGIDFDEHLKKMLSELKILWKEQEAKNQLTPGENLETPVNKFWTNYRSVQRVDFDRTFALRSGLAHLSEYVLIDKDKKETVLRTPTSNLNPQTVKIRNNKFAFVEQKLHPRWGMVDYQNIVVFDLSQNKEKIIKKNARAFYPVLSFDSEKILYHEWDKSQQSRWVVIDSNNSKDQASQVLPKGDLIQSLDWVDEHHIVLLIRRGSYLQIIQKINIDTFETQDILKSNAENLAFVTSDGEWIYYQSSKIGIDQIFRTHLKSKTVQQLTSEKYGAYEPSIKEGTLYYSRYTPEGLRPSKVASLDQNQVSIPEISTHVPYYEHLIQQEGKGDLLISSEESLLASKPYRRKDHLWNPHSWLILAPPLSSSLNLEIQSTDILNNLNLIAGSEYSFIERTPRVYTIANYSEYYPILSLAGSFGGRRKTVETTQGEIDDRWNEGVISYGGSIPYNQLWKAFRFQSDVGVYQSFIHTQGLNSPAYGELSNSSLLSHWVELNYSFLRQKPFRDLNSKLGIVSQNKFEKAKSVHGKNVQGQQLVSQNKWFLPSIFETHSLFGEVSYEKQLENQYLYLTPIAFVRGYKPTTLEQNLKTSLNYALPLIYPEWSLSRYFYLKRLSLNLFYDHALSQKYNLDMAFESHGAELWWDVNFVRNSLPVSFGLRYANPSQGSDDISLFLNAIGMTF